MLLAKPGVCSTCPDPRGQTPFHLGAGTPGIIKMLLNIPKQNITAVLGAWDSYGNLPIHVALEAKAKESVIDMISYAYKYSGYSFTSWMSSAVNGAGDRPVHLSFDYAIFQLLALNGASFAAKNRIGALPLHTASGFVDTAIDGSLKFVLEKHNVSINVADDAGRIPLMYAAAIGDVPNTQWLLARGALYNIRDKNGDVALVHALRAKQTHMVPLLLGGGAPLRVVIQLGYLDVLMDMVVNQSYPVEYVDPKDGRTPIFEGMTEGRVDICKFLVARGATINRLDKHGWSPLAAGLAAGSFDASQFLVDQGAVVMQRLQNNSTPLHVAASVAGSAAVTGFLISAGALVNAVDHRGWTPLHYSVSGGTADVLIGRGANATRTSEEGLLPIHTVAWRGHPEALDRILVWRHSGIDTLDWKGRSALHLAAMSQQAGTAAVLLRFCANFRLRDRMGNRASQYAYDRGLVTLLQSADMANGRCQCDCPLYMLGPAYKTSGWRDTCTASVTCRLRNQGSVVEEVNCVSRAWPPTLVPSKNTTGIWSPASPEQACSIAITSGVSVRSLGLFSLRYFLLIGVALAANVLELVPML